MDKIARVLMLTLGEAIGLGRPADHETSQRWDPPFDEAVEMLKVVEMRAPGF